MEKIKSLEEAANRLRQKEEEISRHLDALQEDVRQTKQDVVGYVKENPWLGLAGSTFAGILVGLLLGKIGKSPRAEKRLEQYVDQLITASRQSGATEEELAQILERAARGTATSVVYASPERKSKGLGSQVLGLLADIGMGLLKKSLLQAIDQQIQAVSAPGEQAAEEQE